MKRAPSKNSVFKFLFTIFLVFCVSVVSLIVLSILFPFLFLAPLHIPTYSAQELWENPLPLSDTISSVTTASGQLIFIEDLCVNLQMTEAEEKNWSAQNTVGISVNSRRVWWGTIYQRELGGLTSSTDYWICFDIPPLESGLHVATIRFEANDGTVHTHEWAFRVE